jgi:hypothetical protein
MGDIEKFMNYLIETFQIKYDASSMRLYERCKKLVANLSRALFKQGLLVRREGTMHRAAAFDEAWTQRRVIWQAYMQSASKVEQNTKPRTPAETKHPRVQKQKRVILFSLITSDKD